MSENKKAFLLFCLGALLPGALTFVFVRLASGPWWLAGVLGVAGWYGGLVALAWAWKRSENRFDRHNEQGGMR